MELAEQEGQVVLFYKYIKIAHPEEHGDWHRNLCQRLKLTGKLRIAEEGLNGTLVMPPPPSHQNFRLLARCLLQAPTWVMLSCSQGGSKAGVEAYRREVDSHPLFAAADIQWKVSPGNANSFGLCPSCAPSPLVSAA